MIQTMETTNKPSDLYSNFASYPIYNVRAKKSVTINNGVNPPMNILAGQVGTFQEIDNSTSLNKNDRIAEATFGGKTIRFHFIGESSNKNRMRELILKNNEFDIIGVPKSIKTNYSNIEARQLEELKDASTTGDTIKAIIDNKKVEAEKTDADKLGDEAFTTEDDSDEKKILGMPKGVAIGVGVVLLAIGGFIAYKKFVAKS